MVLLTVLQTSIPQKAILLISLLVCNEAMDEGQCLK